jgi:hypothetical protein
MAGQADFPYTTVPSSFERLLAKIPTIGTPAKADSKWLTALGLSGGNNQSMIPLMKQLGILDDSGKPTEFYSALRSKDRSKVGTHIKKAYAALFAVYPEAHRQDDEALISFARSKTDYGEQPQRLAVRTFKALTPLGDIGESASDGSGAQGRDPPPERERPLAASSRAKASQGQGGVALTVNIQLQLPPSTDGEIYDKLFAAMAKHLKGLVSLE